jgi:hypothetical protein
MPRNEFKSIRGVFSDIVRRKSDAAKARRKGRDKAAEPSAEVYADSCARIASAFENDGFRYAKSGPHMTRRRNGFAEKVVFQTSYHNIPGQHVSLSVAANVRSKKLKEWRNSQPVSLRKDDWVGGGMIHLLGTNQVYLTWELADPESREDTIADVVDTIRCFALPYFDHFQNIPACLGLLAEYNLPTMDIGNVVEFTLCFGTQEQAQGILDRFLSERGDLADAIVEAKEKMRRQGLPNHLLSAYADQVAFLCLHYGMTLEPNKTLQPTAKRGG